MSQPDENPSQNSELNEARAGRLFRALLAQTQDQVYFKDRQSRFVRCSDVMAAKFGVDSVENLYGKSDFDFFTKEHAKQTFDDEQELMRNNTQFVNVTEKETWPDGRVTWVTSTKIPLLLESGEVSGIMGITRDITKQVEAQREVEKSRVLLQRKNAIMEQDLQSARTVQRMAIPGQMPDVPFAELSVSIASMSEVSGDLVAFPVHSEDKLSFVLGDVSGHGVTAGLFTMLIKHLADYNSRNIATIPDEMLLMLDRHLEGLIPDGFLAAMAGMLEPQSNQTVKLTLANSCQPPIFHYKSNTGEIETVEIVSESAIGLGICESFECTTLTLEPNDCVLIMTDGVTECRNMQGQEIGSAGIAQAFEPHATRPLDELIERLQSHLQAYADENYPQDDTTLLAIRAKAVPSQ